MNDKNYQDELIRGVELCFNTIMETFEDINALAAVKDLQSKKERTLLCVQACFGFDNDSLEGIANGTDKRPVWLTGAWDEIEKLRKIIKDIHYSTDNAYSYNCDVCNHIRKQTSEAIKSFGEAQR